MMTIHVFVRGRVDHNICSTIGTATSTDGEDAPLFDRRWMTSPRGTGQLWHDDSVDDIADLLHRHWGFREADVSLLGGGMNSETWLVEHQGTTYVAKRVPAAELVELTRGCEIASLLADAGIVTGRPVPTMNGELAVPDAALALLSHVPGRELAGESEDEQRQIAGTLAAMHAAGDPVDGTGTAGFLDDWLTPAAPGLEAHPWLAPTIERVRAETDPVRVTWSVLHTDPAPEAFRHDDTSGTTGLIDWTGARRGPVLYDVASAVMYLGGPGNAAAFLDTYRDHGPLGVDELRLLDSFRRFRWTVQATYFAGRVRARDLTGVAHQSDNRRGLANARRGLAELGVDTR